MSAYFFIVPVLVDAPESLNILLVFLGRGYIALVQQIAQENYDVRLRESKSSLKGLGQISVRIEPGQGTVRGSIVGVSQDLWISDKQQARAVI